MPVDQQIFGGSTIRHSTSTPQRSVKELFGHAVALEKAGELEKAVEALQQAATLDPKSGDVQINLAALLEKTGRLDEALVVVRRSVELCPDLAIAHYNLGKVLQSSGQLDAAILAYSDAIELDASFALAYANRGCCQLLLGNYSAGWRDYEWRLGTPTVQIDQYSQPRWNGAPLPEGALLVHGEQGIGDEIQFASCLPDLVPLAKQCVLCCDPRLARLFARSFPAVAIVAHRRKSNGVAPKLPLPIDAQIPAGSVLSHLRKSIADFPPRKRYLLADPKLKHEWGRRFESLGPGLKIGISWFGGGTWEERRHRTSALSDWRELLACNGAQFVNLQYGDCTRELNDAKQAGITIHHFTEADPLGDLDAFAAKVAALDLVISIGNATVHLAGALGVPTWCLVPVVPQWRWGIAGNATPWYPSVHIIRQMERNSWTATLTASAAKLREFITTGKPGESVKTVNLPAMRSISQPPAPKQSAISTSKSIPASNSTEPTTLLRQAAALFNDNRVEAAAVIAEQIVALDADNVAAIRILGVAARKAQQFDRSLELLGRAIELTPNNSALHFERGVTYTEIKQHREAYECFVRATQFQPPFQPAFVNISALLEQQERYEESLQWARKAAKLKPDCPLAHYNLANSLRECGRIPEAIEHYALAVKFRPGYVKAEWNLGICHVLVGQFAKAWPLFELRGVAEEVKFDLYPQPRWDGSSLAGKSIVIHAEQGIGDEVLFASCFDDVIAQAGKTILVCEPRLQKLFARSFPKATVLGWARRKDWGAMPLAEHVDFQLPAGSLPLYFRNRTEEFPRRERFLTVDPALVDSWRQRLSQQGAGLKVGISWRAGGKANEGRKRTIELLDWRQILSTPEVTFVNLQYGDTIEDLASAQNELGVRILDWEQGDPLVDMDSYAAKIAALDLVISVGNAAVHLAGAVGTPAWTLLPRVPSWRWMVTGDDSPWYPSVKLFRQPRRRQWEPVLAQIAARLHEVAAGAKDRTSAERAARIRAVRPQNEPPEAAPIDAAAATANHWLEPRELGSRHPLEVIAALQIQLDTALAARDIVEAERVCREILLITPRHLKAHAALGSIAHQQGRYDHAIRAYQRALSMFESHAANHAALAEALMDAGRSEQALTHAQRAITLEPKLPQAQRALGRALQASGQHLAAAASLNKAAQSIPGDVATICALSRSLTACGRLDQALRMLREQLVERPDNPQIHLAMGEALLEDQEAEEAEMALRRAIELHPSFSAAHIKLSQLLEQQNRVPAALDAARLAVQHAPQSVETLLHLATLLRQADLPAEAESLYRQALEIRPQSAEIMNSLGAVLTELGRGDEALKHYEQALDECPNYLAARANRGLALLESGRFAEGWDEYEWRWQSGQHPRGNRSFSQPQWDGASLAGKTILIHGEQGVGDEIMFATCYPDVIAQAAHAAIVCDARLERLFRRSFPQATILGVPQGSEHRWQAPVGLTIDVQCPAGSLPKFLRRNADTFPRQSQLLSPSLEKVNFWRERLDHLGRSMKIGIAWRTGDGALMPSRRSIPLTNWQSILGTPNVQALSLQYGGNDRQEIAEFAAQSGITILDSAGADHQFDLDGLAAKIAALDLVITVDNTVTHLAGAVGTPTWVLLSRPASWRWLADGAATIWYANIRLFRQGKQQRWDEVFRELRCELLKTNFRVDEVSRRGLPAAPHWSPTPAVAKK